MKQKKNPRFRHATLTFCFLPKFPRTYLGFSIFPEKNGNPEHKVSSLGSPQIPWSYKNNLPRELSQASYQRVKQQPECHRRAAGDAVPEEGVDRRLMELSRTLMVAESSPSAMAPRPSVRLCRSNCSRSRRCRSSRSWFFCSRSRTNSSVSCFIWPRKKCAKINTILQRTYAICWWQRVYLQITSSVKLLTALVPCEQIVFSNCLESGVSGDRVVDKIREIIQTGDVQSPAAIHAESLLWYM